MNSTRIVAILSAILLATYFLVPVLEVNADGEGKSGPQGCLKIKSPGKNAKCPKPPPPNKSITALENL
jgi:hypothetical protein